MDPLAHFIDKLSSPSKFTYITWLYVVMPPLDIMLLHNACMPQQTARCIFSAALCMQHFVKKKKKKILSSSHISESRCLVVLFDLLSVICPAATCVYFYMTLARQMGRHQVTSRKDALSKKYNVKIRNLVCINKGTIAPPATVMRSDKVAGRVKHCQHSSSKRIQDSLQSVCTAHFVLTMEDWNQTSGGVEKCNLIKCLINLESQCLPSQVKFTRLS